MSQDPGSGNGETAQPLPQHPLVGRLKPDPAQPGQQVTELTGLPGDSDRDGYQRLYLTARLDYYAEFLVNDIVYSEAVPADQSPFPGLEATRVGIRRDATISYTWVRSPRPVDEFDLDIRLGGATVGEPARGNQVTYTCGCRGFAPVDQLTYTCGCRGFAPVDQLTNTCACRGFAPVNQITNTCACRGFAPVNQITNTCGCVATPEVAAAFTAASTCHVS